MDRSETWLTLLLEYRSLFAEPHDTGFSEAENVFYRGSSLTLDDHRLEDACSSIPEFSSFPLH